MNVVKVEPREWKKDTGETVVTYWVSLDGHAKDVPCYDARAQDLKVGEALPDGWTIAQSKAGKDYLKPPGKQGGGTKREYVPRYTDTEAGWRANDERVDRRAALAAAQAEGSGITTELAEKFYKWLRSSVSPAGGASGRLAESPGGHSSIPAPGIEGHGGTGHPTARGKDSSASSLGGKRDLATPPVTAPPHIQDIGAGEGADSSSGSPQVSARGESDPTSAPRERSRKASLAGDSEEGKRVGADTSSTDGSTEGVGPIGGIVEGGQKPAVSGKDPGAPSQCLHLKGVFEKRMANGDRVSYCLDCKAKLETVKA